MSDYKRRQAWIKQGDEKSMTTEGNAPTNHGVLTDKEGPGFRGCRILVDSEQEDRPFTVLAFVQKYLDPIEKKVRVCFTTKEGKISKIWPEPVAPSEAQKNIDRENAAGDARKAANDAYVKELAGAPKPKHIEIPPKPLPKEAAPAIVQAVGKFNEKIELIKAKIAPDCTDSEFELLMYMANTYGLDPLLRQIWAVKRNANTPALIFAGRDGMLAIAHRSGHFDGMQSGVVYSGEGKDRKIVSAWCEIWRNDMTHSFKTDVPFSEYNTGYSVWKTNPSAMILKVAESVCLRKAFSVSGLYCPEEIDTGDR
jgi:phage recombination protein Bet